MMMDDVVTDKQIAALIVWHRMDGTKKGDLTTKALKELARLRETAAGVSDSDIKAAKASLSEYRKNGGKSLEDLKRELGFEADEGR